MRRQFCIPLLVVTCFIAGCKAGFMSALVSPQEWSENYALLEGATCTVPEMTDGNLENCWYSPSNIGLLLPCQLVSPFIE